MPGQIPQPGWAADSVPRSRLFMGERPGGRACEVRRSRLIEPWGAGGAAAQSRVAVFCDPHPPLDPSD